MKFSFFAAFSFLCMLLLWPLTNNARAADFQHSYAVVVGINDYSSATQWHHLSYARRDAEAIASYLRSQAFEICPQCELYDQKATKHNILAALHSLAVNLRADDRVLVFMAGHGLNERIGDEIWGYFIPYDGTDTASYIAYTDLQDSSRQMNSARHQLFIMDACFSGLMVKTRSGDVPPDIPNYIDEVTKRIAREVLTAGGDTQEVLDSGPNGHSVFTSALLEALGGAADANLDGYITFAELESYVDWRASNRFQTPASGVLPGHGGGQFVFHSPIRRVTGLQTPVLIPNSTAIKRSDTDQLARAKELLKVRRFSEAMPLFQAAASSGNAEGLRYLGEVYKNGLGVPPDYIQARQWYEKAAAAGDAGAMNAIGSLYELGQGVPQ
ncbi:MAG: caspase family protein, partial [Candidatus Udaeobacter sp.]